MRDPALSVQDKTASEGQEGAPTARSKVSRRKLLAGLAGTVTILGGGGVAWWALTPHSLYTYHGHSSYAVLGVVWSHDGMHIASCALDGTVQIWNAHYGQRISTFNGLNSHLPSMAWSPDNKYLAFTNEDDAIQIWELPQRRIVATYSRAGSQISSLAWSPESKRLAIGYANRIVQVVHIEHINDEKYTYTRGGHSSQVSVLAWSPDGKRIASGSLDTTVQIWNATDGSNIFVYRGHERHPVSALAWAPNGKYIVSASGPIDDNAAPVASDVRVWNPVNGHLVSIYSGHENYVDYLAWSPDSRRIASASQDATVHVWGITGGKDRYIYRGHISGVYSVAWSSANGLIASGANDGTVQVWIAK